MRVNTLDFETYYDKDFSLSKMSTEDYVFDDRFEIIGVTVMDGDGKVERFSGTERDTYVFLSNRKIHEGAVCAHNARFDGLILARLGLYPKFYLDTLSMARPLYGSVLKSLSLASLVKHLQLGEKGDEVVRALGKRRADFTPEELSTYLDYCANDTWLTRQLYKHMRPIIPSPDDELRAIDLTLRMYLQPVLHLDADTLRQNLVDVQRKKAAILAELEVSGVTGDVLRSNDKFAALLRSKGIEPPMKLSKKKTETAGHPVMTYAFSKTDPEFIELQEEVAEDIELSMIINGRISEKSTQEETRTEKFLTIAERYGNLRVPLAYYKAHTGRYGGDEGINMQNPPRVDKSRMRFSIRPPDGYVMVVADLSQIEAREVAMLAGQDDLVQGFANGEDVYSQYATELYGQAPGVIHKKNPDPVVQKQRFVGKETVLGAGFGMGPDRFRNAIRGKGGLILPPGEAERIIQFYRQKYSMIPELWRQFEYAFGGLVMYGKETRIGPVLVCRDDVTGQARILGPNGMSLWYPKLRKVDHEWTFQRPSHKIPQKIFGGMWTENVAQFLANIIIKQKMIKVHRTLGLPPRLQAHDAVGWVVHKDALDEKLPGIEAIMAEAPVWWPYLPVAAETKVGNTYGDV
jgi:DNA polymerase